MQPSRPRHHGLRTEAGAIVRDRDVPSRSAHFDAKASELRNAPAAKLSATVAAVERFRMKSWLISALAVAACASPASSQSPTPAAIVPPPRVLSAQIQPGMTLDGLLANTRRSFRTLDANADSRLDQDDATLHESAMGANLRISAAMQIMASDLDGDGSVTEEELRLKRRYDRRNQEGRDAQAGEAQLRVEIGKVMAADADKDGRISWSEAVNFVSRTQNHDQHRSNGPQAQIRDLLAFIGPDRTSVTVPEFDQLALTLFRGADTDGNGTISQDEFAALRSQDEQRQRAEADARRQRRAEEARAGCALPKASDAAKVILLSAYESDSLSTTAIGSQDVGTGTGSIVVEPGEGPLYVVVAAFRPVIWRFSGAVERIERVVLAAQMTGPGSSKPDAAPLAGATGLAADKLTFLPRSDCLRHFSEVPSSHAAITAGIVRRETGKEPVVAGRYQVSGFSIPSAELRTTGRADRPMVIISKPSGTLRIEGGANVVVEAGTRDLASDVARFYPGGVVEIAPETVFASDKPVRYEVLPNQAGLLQLVQRGALARNQSGEFLIKEKIRFPAEMNGAHAARFLLLRGIPVPDGSPGHSCVISEETGRPLTRGGPAC